MLGSGTHLQRRENPHASPAARNLSLAKLAQEGAVDQETRNPEGTDWRRARRQAVALGGSGADRRHDSAGARGRYAATQWKCDPQTFSAVSSNPDVPVSIVSATFWTVGVSYTDPTDSNNDFTGSLTFALFGNLTPNTVRPARFRRRHAGQDCQRAGHGQLHHR